MTAAPSASPSARADSRPAALRIRYVKLGRLPHHVYNNVVYAMEASLARLNLGYKLSPRNTFTAYANRALAKLRLVRPIARVSRTAYLVPTGQAAESRFCPVTFFHPVVPWIFDAWPNLWERIEGVLRRQRVRLAFFTARQAADHFRQRLGIDAVWMPEACDASVFDASKALVDRPIDVLELGRKYDRYHDGIAPRLAERGKTHLFEKVKGQLIFPTEQAMRDGFANARVSVCFPSSMTHPARSGHVETVTLRYFESMAARSLVVGHCPAELKEVMGYDPVITADMNDPAGQIDRILDRIGDYQELVDRNYAQVLRAGVWDVRLGQLLDELASRGYHP
ncbi:MAG TPA: glycosyltransferase [Tepidisphaeraceae bacterium]|jgi:hypothetical protein